MGIFCYYIQKGCVYQQHLSKWEVFSIKDKVLQYYYYNIKAVQLIEFDYHAH